MRLTLSESHQSRAELTCDDVEALLPLVADGAIDDISDPAVFVHLARCSNCQGSLVCHDLVGLSLQSGIHEPRRATRALHVRLPWPAAVAVAAGLAAVVGVWLWPTPLTSAPPVLATQVIRVPGPDATRPYYVVVQGDQIMVVDPTNGDHHHEHEVKPAMHQVTFERH